MKGRTKVERKKEATSESSPSIFAPSSETFDSSKQPAPPAVGHSFSNLSTLQPQAKLSVSQPGDQYEKEADRVADQVMRMEKSGDEIESTVPQIARKEQRDIPLADDVTPIAQAGLQSSGQALDAETRAFMEPRFGHDFSRVRVHSGAAAAQSARNLCANAYTVGHHIAFDSGRFAPATHGGQRLIAHELTHVVQQSGAGADGIRAGQSAEKFGPSSISLSRAHTQPFLIQRKENGDGADGTKAPGVPSFQQMNKAPTTGAAIKDLPPRNDVELMGVRLKARQLDFADFLTTISADINNIRGYYKWVSGVYDRTYGHYDLVIKQANAQADTQQQVLDFFVGAATGVAIGLLSEVVVGFYALKTGAEALGEIAAEFVEGGVGLFLKPKIGRAEISDELNPAFKKVQALHNLDELNSAALTMAIPGPFNYTNPIVQSERLSAELRVAEAHGERKLSDDDIRQGYLKLMRFSLQSLMIENELKEQRANFDKLQATYMGKQAPSDQRCEQDIWIQWLAKQNPVGSWGGMFGSIVQNKVIVNHLVDLGLVGRGTRGGRLNADVEYHNPTFEPGHDDDEAIGWQIVSGAKAEATSLNVYWNDVFLMGVAQKK